MVYLGWFFGLKQEPISVIEIRPSLSSSILLNNLIITSLRRWLNSPNDNSNLKNTNL
jgi:hypothetical protein